MLPTPLTRPWSSRSRFTPAVRRRRRATNATSSNAGSSGSRAMCAISVGSSAPPSAKDRPPNIRWSTNRSSGPPSANRNRTRRWRSSAASAGCTSIWPLMPRWPSRASPVSRGSHRYLPRRRASENVRPVSRATKSSGPARCRRTGRGWSTSTAATGRWSTCASSPRRTTSTSGSSGTLPVRGARGGGVAVLVGERAVRRLGGLLLGLLLRATDTVAVRPVADAHPCGEGLLVVGALVLDQVLGDAELVDRRELLEAGLPVKSRAESGCGLQQRVEEQMDHLGCVVEAAAEVDRTDHGLDRVGEDRRLVAATGRLLALAELDVLAEADGAGHLSQGAGVDDGRAQLGQQSLGERGLGDVEGLGDDHPEHRVPEELEPLVGGHATVLVGVGPVRQGKIQQLVG